MRLVSSMKFLQGVTNGGISMGAKLCKGLCDNNKDTQWKKGYHSGQRYCKACNLYLETSDLMCNCCKNWLRRKKRHNKQT